MNPFLNMGRMLNGMGDHGAESERIPAEYDLHDPCGMNNRHETGDNTQKLDDERREHPVDGKNGRHAAEGERTDVAERHKERISTLLQPLNQSRKRYAIETLRNSAATFTNSHQQGK